MPNRRSRRPAGNSSSRLLLLLERRLGRSDIPPQESVDSSRGYCPTRARSSLHLLSMVLLSESVALRQEVAKVAGLSPSRSVRGSSGTMEGDYALGELSEVVVGAAARR